MNLLINAISIREGGPLTVLTKLTDEMARQSPDTKLTVVANQGALRALASAPNLHTIVHSGAEATPAHLFAFYNLMLPQLAKDADVVFSMTNYLPTHRLPAPAVLLVQNAGHFSNHFEDLIRSSQGPVGHLSWRLKSQWVCASIRRARRVLTQSAALGEAIGRKVPNLPHPIDVVAHGPGLVELAQQPRQGLSQGPIRLGYVTKHGIQKNIGIALEAVALLISRGHDINLTLTLDARDHAFAAIANKINTLGLADRVDNMGDVRREKIASLYDGLDIFLFCSSLESFGLPMVEALARALPTIAADTPVNREVTGEAALFYAPGSASALADHVEAIIRSPQNYRQCSAASLKRARDFSWATAASRTLAILHETATAERQDRMPL